MRYCSRMVINTIIPYLLMLKRNKISDAEELTRDLMALLASFSGKYYGRRSLERRKQNKNDNRDK